MLTKRVSVSAPSRLHFGLLSIGQLTARKFGGAGLMIDGPRTEVAVESCNALQIVASQGVKDLARETISLWQQKFASGWEGECELQEIPVRLTIRNAPRHRGFGSGTQLAFALASALQLAFDEPLPSAEEMAMALGRGKRSAIGSYGFFEGGFLVDRGIDREAIAPLDMRTDFPEDWKVVLAQPAGGGEASVFGEAERQAFRELPGTTQKQADQLASLLKEEVLPSVLNQDFATFADAVTQYGYQSGMYYSEILGGAYASAAANALVEKVRRLGPFAVGQSSWGPTIFAIGPSEKEANWLVEKLSNDTENVVDHIEVVSADNRGMRIDTISSH